MSVKFIAAIRKMLNMFISNKEKTYKGIEDAQKDIDSLLAMINLTYREFINTGLCFIINRTGHLRVEYSFNTLLGIAKDIEHFLRKNNYIEGVKIYINSGSEVIPEVGSNYICVGTPPFDFYNPYSISLFFEESPIRHIFNYDIENEEFINAFNGIINKYGFYWKLGNSWNMSLYDI